MAFNKKVFYKKAEKWIRDNNWKDYSYLIDSELQKYRLEEFPYKPQYLISKDKIPFFLQFFQKGDWSYAKKLDFAGTGIDFYKYKFLEALQAITRIQVGLVMHNETSDSFVFRQLDQLPKPVIFWKGNMCYAHELRYHELEYNCFKCFETRPSITHECLHRHKQNKNKKKREMAMWKVSEFANEFIIQPKLIN